MLIEFLLSIVVGVVIGCFIVGYRMKKKHGYDSIITGFLVWRKLEKLKIQEARDNLKKAAYSLDEEAQRIYEKEKNE